MSNDTKNIWPKIKTRLIKIGRNLKNAVSVRKFFRTFLYHTYYYVLSKKKLAGVSLGSGQTPVKNFLNIDTDWFIPSDVVAGVEKLKVADNSAEIIYTSHLFEHTNRTQALKILAEWHRALLPDGKLYIAVPDLEKLFKIYLEEIERYEDDGARASADKACRIIYGGQTNKYDYHYYGYSFITLKYLLEQVGFKNIERFDPRTDKLVPANNDSSFATISLNVKAQK